MTKKKVQAQSYWDNIQKFATSMNITQECAMDVLYLRSKKRHTRELENKLIELHRKGTPPKIETFGFSEELQNKHSQYKELQKEDNKYRLGQRLPYAQEPLR